MRSEFVDPGKASQQPHPTLIFNRLPIDQIVLGQLSERLKPVAIVYSFRRRHCPFRRAEGKKTFAAPLMQKLQDASSHHGIFHGDEYGSRREIEQLIFESPSRADRTNSYIVVALLCHIPFH